MQETKRYKITQKVFTKADLLKIGRVLVVEEESAQKAKERSKLSFQLSCKDDTSYESGSLELFNDNGIADIKVFTSIDMLFFNFTQARWINITITHGSYSSGNTLTVQGNDANWVNGTFNKLKDIIDSARPQNNWIIKHKTLFWCILTFGLGVLIYSWWGLVMRSFIVPDLKENVRNEAEKAFVALLTTLWFIGCVGALYLRDWVLELWPKIELDFGPEHLKTEKMRRNRIMLVISMFVIPFLLSIFSDEIKALFAK